MLPYGPLISSALSGVNPVGFPPVPAEVTSDTTQAVEGAPVALHTCPELGGTFKRGFQPQEVSAVLLLPGDAPWMSLTPLIW